MLITLDDADRLRQWFDAICDVNPQFLDSDDYRLGLSLYDACGMHPSNKLQQDAAGAPDGDRIGEIIRQLEISVEKVEASRAPAKNTD